MVWNSSIQEATIISNGGKESLDTNTAPFERNGKVFIPVEIFLALFEMKLSENTDGTIGFMQFKNDFNESNLIVVELGCILYNKRYFKDGFAQHRGNDMIK